MTPAPARAIAAGLAVALLAFACSDSSDGTAATTAAPPETTVATGAPDPGAAVRLWLDALASGNGPAATRLAAPRQLTAVIVVENSLPPDEAAAMARAGVSEATASEYWASLATSFADFAGVGPGELLVGRSDDFDVSGTRFAAVTVSRPSEVGTTEIITVADEAGRWHVDMMALVGPSLVRPIRELIAGLPRDADGATVRELFAASVQSLRAALERPGAEDLPLEFVLEVESLVRFLDRS